MRLFAVRLHADESDALLPTRSEVISARCWSAGAAGIWEQETPEGVELRVGVPAEHADAFLAALADVGPEDVTDAEAVELATRDVTITIADDELAVTVPPTVFGDGNHPTTSACLELLVGCVGHGDRVLDIGCGSGVLSVAAATLGAEVTAIDIDPVAVEATVANAEAAGQTVEASTTPLSDLPAEPFDVVGANISAGTLLELADDILARTGRDLIVSGILTPRWDEVRDRLDLPLVSERIEAGWVTAHLRR